MISSNHYLSSLSGLTKKQLDQAENCKICKGSHKRLVTLSQNITQSSSEYDQKQALTTLQGSRAIGNINQHHPFISDFLLKISGLTHRQLEHANSCKNCFKHFLSLKNSIKQNPNNEKSTKISSFQNKQATEEIDQHHPFDMKLINKYTNLTDYNIIEIKKCPNENCNCKNVWNNLKQLLETIEYGVQDKYTAYQIDFLENTILDPLELHSLIRENNN